MLIYSTTYQVIRYNVTVNAIFGLREYIGKVNDRKIKSKYSERQK